MRVQRSCPCVGPFLGDEDRQLQSAVLLHLLNLFPLPLAQDDLVATLNREPENAVERDELDQAIRELVTVGLVRRYGSLVLPTQTAFRSYELWEA